MRRGLALPLALCVALLAAAPAHGAPKQCGEPGATWERATPAEAEMDAGKLAAAMDYATQNGAAAARVYRYGCLVAEDDLASLNRNQRYQSWSAAKSVTALLFGRAWTLEEIGPDDPVGGLFPEADQAHGRILMRHLLEMSSGLEWNGFRDYNIFTMRDRVRDALTLRVVRTPGTYYEYAQSAVALLAEAVRRATGVDPQTFIQTRLLRHLGIADDAWYWQRDSEGHVLGFMGVMMRPDDYGRMGELLRRGGVWRGDRLLSRRFLAEALTPKPTNGCYGWLIWLNASKPCVGPRIQDRPVEDNRQFPTLPADQYQFAGLFGQLVTVFPSQGIVVVRLGNDPGTLAGGADWERELYTRILDAMTAGRPPAPPDAGTSQPVDRSESDGGFQNAIADPARYQQGANPEPLPPAGPARARAAMLFPRGLQRPSPVRNRVTVELRCPRRWPGTAVTRCRGTAQLQGATAPTRYDVAPGRRRAVPFYLSAKTIRTLARRGRMALAVTATNADRADGTPVRDTLVVLRKRGSR